MNNKKLGSAFERELCDLFAKDGYWVHFIAPDNRGAQPFDVIVVKNGAAQVFDCKTSTSHLFGIDRLEDNQRFAFERWVRCGNAMPHLAVKYRSNIYMIPYARIASGRKVDLDKEKEYLWRTGV